MDTIIIAIVVLSLVAGLAAVRYLLHTERRLTSVEHRLSQLEAERQHVLDDAAKRGQGHHAYNTKAGLESAISNLIGAEFDINVLEANLKTALGTLQVLRRSPEKYDPNEGKKP